MKLTNTIKANLIILRIAQQNNKPAGKIRQAIQKALDASWAEVWTPGNIDAQVSWQRLFGGAGKPSVEEFIVCLASHIRLKATDKSIIEPSFHYVQNLNSN